MPKMDHAEKIKDYQELKPGDYVVHVNHGIGKYIGIETLEVGGMHKDYHAHPVCRKRQALRAGGANRPSAKVCRQRGKNAEGLQSGRQRMEQGEK